jgi:hypothetical protein
MLHTVSCYYKRRSWRGVITTYDKRQPQQHLFITVCTSVRLLKYSSIPTMYGISRQRVFTSLDFRTNYYIYLCVV